MQKHILECSVAIPTAMKYGLTPPLALLPHSPYWCDDLERFLSHDLSTDALAAIGVDRTFNYQDQ